MPVIIRFAFIAMLLGISAYPAGAEDAIEAFYKGKTVQMIIGSSSGGGYDLYGRLIARYIGKYIPGHPTIIATNMSGAASIVATHHIAFTAPKDGTVIGAIYPGALTETLLGDAGKIRYDVTKLGYIGSANNEIYVCIVRGDANIHTFNDFITKNVLIGASAAGGSTRDFPSLLVSSFGANFKIVSGYPGSSEILLAIEKGEVQGTCGIGWSTISVQKRQWLDSGFIKVIAQEGMKSDPELNKAHVPMALSFATTAQQRKLMELFYAPLTFGRPFIVAPDVPAERLAALRKAFMQTMADPELKAEAEKVHLDVDAISGEEVRKTIVSIYQTKADIVAQAKAAIGSH